MTLEEAKANRVFNILNKMAKDNPSMFKNTMKRNALKQNKTKKIFIPCKNLWAIWYLIKTPRSKLSLHDLICYVHDKCLKDKK